MRVGLLVLFIVSTNGNAQPEEQSVKDILLTSYPVGGSSHLEGLRGFQRHSGISDEKMSNILKSLADNALPDENDPIARELALNAISAMSNYGSDSVKELLCDVIEKKKGSFRHRAIESYMRLVNHVVAGPVANVITNTAKYDDMDRRTVYEELIRASQTADEAKKNVIVSELGNFVVREQDKSKFVLLDRFLVTAEKKYAASPRRLEMLRMHACQHGGNSPDMYVDRELYKISEKVQ